MTDDPLSPWASAAVIAAAVRAGRVSAVDVSTAALDRVQALNPGINAYTDVTTARALQEARAIDAARAAGLPLGPLAGVPFAAKAKVLAESYLTDIDEMIQDDKTPASTRLNAIQSVVRWGKLEPTKDTGTDTSSTGQINIQINF